MNFQKKTSHRVPSSHDAKHTQNQLTPNSASNHRVRQDLVQPRRHHHTLFRKGKIENPLPPSPPPTTWTAPNRRDRIIILDPPTRRVPLPEKTRTRQPPVRRLCLCGLDNGSMRRRRHLLLVRQRRMRIRRLRWRRRRRGAAHDDLMGGQVLPRVV